MVADQSLILWQPVADWFSNFNDDPKFTRRPIGEWLAIGWRLVCNWSATDCRSKIWSVIGCRWLSMVVGCRWSATGCRYSVTEALHVTKRIDEQTKCFQYITNTQTPNLCNKNTSRKRTKISANTGQFRKGSRAWTNEFLSIFLKVEMEVHSFRLTGRLFHNFGANAVKAWSPTDLYVIHDLTFDLSTKDIYLRNFQLSLRVRLVIPKVRYSEHANFLYLEVC